MSPSPEARRMSHFSSLLFSNDQLWTLALQECSPDRPINSGFSFYTISPIMLSSLQSGPAEAP